MKEERISVPISWNKGGNNVYITGTFEEYNFTKLSDKNGVYNQNGVKEKSVSLWLKPDVYYYRYIVDGKDIIDESKPTKSFRMEKTNKINTGNFDNSNDKQFNSQKTSNSNINLNNPIGNEPVVYPGINLNNKYDVVVTESGKIEKKEKIEKIEKIENFEKPIQSLFKKNIQELIPATTSSTPANFLQNKSNKINENNNTLVSEKSNISNRNSNLHRNLLKLKNSITSNPNNTQNNIPTLNHTKYHSKNQSNLNFLDISANFSMNIENMAVNYLDTNNELNISHNLSGEDNFSLNDREYKNNLIIVYKLAGDFLVPMQVLSEDDKNNSIKLKYLLKDESHGLVKNNMEINVKRDSIFYQQLVENCLSGVECLTSLDEFNELSILKNIIIRINNKQNYCILNDIFMFFINNKNEKDFVKLFTNYNFEFFQWINLKIDDDSEDINSVQDNNSNLIFIKNKYFKSEHNNNTKNYNNNSSLVLNNSHQFQFDIFVEILKFKNYNLYTNYRGLFNKLFLFAQLFKMNSFLIFNFSEKINNYSNFHFFNLFPTQTIKNELKNNIIISCKNVDFSNRENLSTGIIKNKIINLLNDIDLENLISLKYEIFLIAISEEMLNFKGNDRHLNKTSNIYLVLSEIIKEILEEIKMVHLFPIIFLMLIISFIFANFKLIFIKNKISKTSPYFLIYEEISKNISFINIEKSENLMFYSNLIIIFIYKFIFDLISSKFKENVTSKSKTFKNLKEINNQKNSKNKNEKQINLGLILSDPEFSNEDDLILFNDLLFNKLSTYSDNLTNNKSILSKFIKFNFDENISVLLKNLKFNQNEMNVILFFEKLIDLKFFYDFYNSDNNVKNKNDQKYLKITDLIQISYKLSINEIEKIENNNLVIKQIWSFQFENLDNFFTVEENVIDILQNNKIIEYAKYYKNPKKFYADFSMKMFFAKFLPILEDIDKVFDPKKKYEEFVNIFFNDLQKFEEFSENFEVNNKRVKINFLTYSILLKIIKNIIEEKIVIIQKNYKRKTIYNFINYFRSKVVKIQNSWRNYYFNKFPDFDYNKYLSYVGDRYIKHDPILIKIFRNTFKKINTLTEEKNSLQSELNESNIEKLNYVKENTNLKFSIDELKKKQICLQNDNISLASSTNSQKSSGHILNTPFSNKNSSMMSSRLKNSKGTPQTSYNESYIDNEMKKNLESKLHNYKSKYQDLVKVISEHEKKMEKLVGIINSKQEIKDILAKYGIKIN